jgi:hypothetical protein
MHNTRIIKKHFWSCYPDFIFRFDFEQHFNKNKRWIFTSEINRKKTCYPCKNRESIKTYQNQNDYMWFWLIMPWTYRYDLIPGARWQSLLMFQSCHGRTVMFWFQAPGDSHYLYFSDLCSILGKNRFSFHSFNSCLRFHPFDPSFYVLDLKIEILRHGYTLVLSFCFEHILLKYSKGLGTSSGNLLVPLPT